MNRGLKLALKILGGIVLVLVALAGGLFYSAFAHNSPIDDGREIGAVRIVKDGFVSAGVVDLGGGKVALIDAGNDKTGKALLAELTRRKLGPDAVEAIFLTHGHADHTAGCALFPKASIYALAADIGVAEGREGGHGPISGMMGVHPSGLKVTRGLVDGETVTVGTTAVKVFAVPGHTAGSAAYLVDGVLFLGDSASSNKDGTLMPAVWAFSDDAAQNHASLKALAQRLASDAASVKVLAPAHSGVLDSLGPLTAYGASQ